MASSLDESESNVALGLATALLPDVSHHHETEHTLDEEDVRVATTERAFAAAQRAYNDDEDERAYNDDEDERAYNDDEDEDEAAADLTISANLATTGTDLEAALLERQHLTRRHHRQLDEDEWPDDDIATVSSQAGELSWKTWLREQWSRFWTCPWRPSSYVKLAVGLLAAAAVVALAVYFSDTQRQDAFRSWIDSLGLWGNLVFLLAFVFANLPFGFGFVFIVSTCGYLYSPVLAALTVLAGVFLGLTVCYWFIRWFLVDSFNRTVARNRKLQVLVFAARANGVKLSFLIRYIPITVGLQTGVLAIADIPYLTMIVCGMIADLPKLALLIYVGYQLRADSQVDSWDAVHIVSYVVGAALFVAAIAFMGYIGRKALRQASEEMDRQQGVIEVEMHAIND